MISKKKRIKLQVKKHLLAFRNTKSLYLSLIILFKAP